jgi:hypothetical protein
MATVRIFEVISPKIIDGFCVKAISYSQKSTNIFVTVKVVGATKLVGL